MAGQWIGKQANTHEKTIPLNIPFEKLQQIFKYIGVCGKFLDICSIIKKHKICDNNEKNKIYSTNCADYIIQHLVRQAQNYFFFGR